MDLTFFLMLFVLGALTGVVSGFLGIGGGLILVPALFYLLGGLGYAEHAMHLALGSSLLIILLTTSASAWAHHRAGKVNHTLVKQFAPCVLIGASAGCWLAQQLQTEILTLIFALGQGLMGLVLLGVKPKTNQAISMPSAPWFQMVGCSNACLATLMGIGGGIPNTAFMTLCRTPLPQAIATSAMLSPLLSLIGATGFIWMGSQATHLPFGSLGYVNLPIVAAIGSAAMLTAPLGAKLTHQVPQNLLKKIFVGLMLGTASLMAYQS